MILRLFWDYWCLTTTNNCFHQYKTLLLILLLSNKYCRQLLNLGHTVGHAIEALSNFDISHGSAVAIGMVIVTKISVSLGYCTQNDLDELVELLKKEGLPTICDFTANDLANIASADKKRSGGNISFILPYSIGNCKPVKVPVDELCDFIAKGL